MYGDVICKECETINPRIEKFMGHYICRECGSMDSIEDMDQWLAEE